MIHGRLPFKMRQVVQDETACYYPIVTLIQARMRKQILTDYNLTSPIKLLKMFNKACLLLNAGAECSGNQSFNFL